MLSPNSCTKSFLTLSFLASVPSNVFIVCFPATTHTTCTCSSTITCLLSHSRQGEFSVLYIHCSIAYDSEQFNLSSNQISPDPTAIRILSSSPIVAAFFRRISAYSVRSGDVPCLVLLPRTFFFNAPQKLKKYSSSYQAQREGLRGSTSHTWRLQRFWVRHDDNYKTLH